MKNIKSPDVILSYNHSIIVYSTGKTRKHLLLLAHPHPKFILRINLCRRPGRYDYLVNTNVLL
jgi:hypothetical protein